jgi:hypothetical protein
MKIKKKVLLVANNGPEPSFGGGQRNILIGKLLEDQGFEVEMVLLIDSNWGEYSYQSDLINKWNNIFHIVKLFQPDFSNPFFIDLKVYNFLRRIQKNYDWIIFRYEKTAFKSGFYLLNRNRIIIDFDDFNLKFLKGIKKNLHSFRHVFQLAFIKKALITDENIAKYFCSNTICVPNLPLIEFYSTEAEVKFEKERTSFPSVFHICNNISSLIEFVNSDDYVEFSKTHANFKLFVVNRSQLNKKSFNQEKNNKCNNLEWYEDLHDISIIYKKSWIQLILEKKEVGTHIKLIESQYYLTPVVCFEEAIRGYEKFNEKSELILCAQSNKGLLKNIERLIVNHIELNFIIKESKKVQESFFSFKSISQQIRTQKYFLNSI